MLERYHLEEGDTVHLIETEEGILITPFDPSFEEAMEIYEDGAKRYHSDQIQAHGGSTGLRTEASWSPLWSDLATAFATIPTPIWPPLRQRTEAHSPAYRRFWPGALGAAQVSPEPPEIHRHRRTWTRRRAHPGRG